MIRIALTGATGFIGSYVLAELNSMSGISVVAVSRTANKVASDIRNGRWVAMDLKNPPPHITKVLGFPDVLIHLAWDGLPNYKSLHHYENELPLQYAFLKKVVKEGLKSVFISGSCAEYGVQSGELDEQIDAQPQTPYAFAKDVLRKELVYLRANCSFNLTWGRLFYVYGQGQSKLSLIGQLEEAVNKGDKVFNMSGGEQLRDYMQVEEMARKIVALALRQGDLGIVNICSGRPQSIRSLVERLIAKRGYDIVMNLGHYPYLDYEPMAFWGSTKKFDEIHG